MKLHLPSCLRRVALRVAAPFVSVASIGCFGVGFCLLSLPAQAEPWYKELPEEQIKPEGELIKIQGSIDTSSTPHGLGLADQEDKYKQGVLLTDEMSLSGKEKSVFGGSSAANPIEGGFADVAQDEVWIQAQGGSYDIIAGGNYNYWRGAYGFDYNDEIFSCMDDTDKGHYAQSFSTKATHIILGGPESSASASVWGIVGGNYGNACMGEGIKQISDMTMPSFTGDSYISIYSDSVEWVAGGSAMYTLYSGNWKEKTSVFKGNSHIYVHTLLSNMVYEIDSEIDSDFIAGGNYINTYKSSEYVNSKGKGSDLSRSWFGNDSSCNFMGDTYVIIDLEDKYRGGEVGENLFNKKIAGGDYVIGGGMQVAHNGTGDGNNNVYIGAANGVTFSELIIGGSLVVGYAKIYNAGNTNMYIDSGYFRNMVIGGSFVVSSSDWLKGLSYLDRNTEIIDFSSINLTIAGGTFYGFEDLVYGEYGCGYEQSIGNIALIGRSYHYAEEGKIEYEAHLRNTVKVAGGADFGGHIVGDSVVESRSRGWGGYYHGEWEVRSQGSEMSLQNVNMFHDKSVEMEPRIIGGCVFRIPYLFEMWQERSNGNYNIELENYDVSISGTSHVYDVVGGSWMLGLNEDRYNIDDANIKQKSVNVSLGSSMSSLKDNIIVEGDIYAAGIQDGNCNIETKNTSVSLTSGVVFTDSETPHVVSGGYLSIWHFIVGPRYDSVWSELKTAYGTFYDDGTLDRVGRPNHVSYVVENRELTFNSKGVSFDSSFENVHFVNFDYVHVDPVENTQKWGYDREMQLSPTVVVGAMMITDEVVGDIYSGIEIPDKDTVHISGGGKIGLRGQKIKVLDEQKSRANMQAEYKEVLNNSKISLTGDGTILHFLPPSKKGNSWITGVKVSSGSHLVLDMYDDKDSEKYTDGFYVMDKIDASKGGNLHMRIHLKEKLDYFSPQWTSDDSIVRQAPGSSSDYVANLEGMNFSLVINRMDMYGWRNEAAYVLVDKLEKTRNFTITDVTRETLYKWFSSGDVNSAEIRVVDDKLVLYIYPQQDNIDKPGNPTPIPPVMVPVPWPKNEDPDEDPSNDPTPIPPVLVPVPWPEGDNNPTPIPPVLVPVPWPDNEEEPDEEPSYDPTPIPPVLVPVPWPDDVEPDTPGDEPEKKPIPSYHRKRSKTPNGHAGGTLLDEYYPTPSNDENGDRERVLDRVFDLNVDGKYKESDRLQAAVAGSSISTLGAAAADDVERQMRLMRNRATRSLREEAVRLRQREVDGGKAGICIHEYPEPVPAKRTDVWLNAEGDYRQTNDWITDPGYRMNAWGGTVGASYAVSDALEAGLALTAMYGDLRTKGPDVLQGDMDTQYLSGFVRLDSGRWSQLFIATVGLVDTEATRTVNIGEDYGAYNTHFETEGYALGLMYELGYNFMLNREKTAVLQPVVNVAWRHVELKGFSESGSDAALRAGNQRVDTLIVGGGLRGQALVGGETLGSNLLVELRALAKGYIGNVRNRVEVGFTDRAQRATVRNREAGALGVEVGVGLSLPLTPSWEYEHAIFMDVTLELREAYENANITLGYKLSF